MRSGGSREFRLKSGSAARIKELNLEILGTSVDNEWRNIDKNLKHDAKYSNRACTSWKAAVKSEDDEQMREAWEVYIDEYRKVRGRLERPRDKSGSIIDDWDNALKECQELYHVWIAAYRKNDVARSQSNYIKWYILRHRLESANLLENDTRCWKLFEEWRTVQHLEESSNLREVWRLYYNSRVLSLTTDIDAPLYRELMASIKEVSDTKALNEYFHKLWQRLENDGQVEHAERAKLKYLDSRLSPTLLTPVYSHASASSSPRTSLSSLWLNSSRSTLSTVASSIDEALGRLSPRVPRRDCISPIQGMDWIPELQEDSTSECDVENDPTTNEVQSQAPKSKPPLPTYHYEALEEDGGDKRKIRLLTILPDKHSDGQFRCKISTVNFAATATHIRFQAVSYAWGPAEHTHELICNDDKYRPPVSARLHDNIARLHEYSTRYSSQASSSFWIDAICINQSDGVEKSRQVPRMADIFRRAEHVHVFLNDGCDTISWHQSEWFKRRWVVQELLAAHDIVVHLPRLPQAHENTQETDWESFVGQLDFNSQKYALDKLDPDVLGTIEHLKTLRTSGTVHPGVFSMLFNFQHTDCSDDRDRIYSFTAVSNDVRAQIPTDPQFGTHTNPMILFQPDYTLSTNETYKRFACAALQSAYPYQALQCAGAFRSSPSGDNWQSTTKDNISHRVNDEIAALLNLTIRPEHCALPTAKAFLNPGSLPSYIPDWRYKAFYTPYLDIPEHRAGIEPPALSRTRRFVQPTILDDGVTLKLTGLYIGRVTAVVSGTPWGSRTSRVNVRERQRAEAHGLRYQRVGFMTDDGKTGVGPPSTKMGDHVFLFPRARTPFVLRPCFNWRGYRLVGDCIVHGAMEGQLATAAAEKSSEILII